MTVSNRTAGAPRRPAGRTPAQATKQATAPVSGPVLGALRPWSRRQWLTSQALGLAALTPVGGRPARGHWRRRATPAVPAALQARVARQAEPLDPASWEVLAQRAVEAAQRAGASYAEARLTRRVVHHYQVAGPFFEEEQEWVGVGVRALVGGYWGFSASTVIAPDEVVRLAQDAVGQAQENAKGAPWPVALGTIPVAIGHWATPLRIDPFTVPIEEKLDFISYWKACVADVGLAGWSPSNEWGPAWLSFVRQERVVATTEGARFTQTIYESGGEIKVDADGQTYVPLHGIDWAGAGWELFLDANIPEQLFSGRIGQELAKKGAVQKKPFQLGKYTLVCDGATMAAFVEATLGQATQLDRALGYEANANGTSWLDDPLGLVGTAQIAAPGVTLTANRSAPGELATVKWDEEGVEPQPFTLVKDGVLVDFQTTREQAAWLAPYYQQHGQPVASHGCAMAESAHLIPLQQLPNLSLEPNPAAVRLEDLVADVPVGILVEGGEITSMDFQGRTGLLRGGGSGSGMREIRNGRLGKELVGGEVFFNSQSFWKAITAVGGATTQDVVNFNANFSHMRLLLLQFSHSRDWFTRKEKGEPPQITSHSVRAVAATIPNQPVIDPSRKA